MGPCDWPVLLSGCDEQDTAFLDGLSPGVREAAESMATEYLWRWTGGAFGVCSSTVRPCRRGCYPESTWNGLVGVDRQVIVNGSTGSVVIDSGCGCAADCCHPSRSTMHLPGPVVSVEEVKIDGEVMDPALYRVDNGHLLVRVDGMVWPDCQALDLPDTEQGTFSITYSRGIAVPAGGQIAAGVLLVEFAKAICDDSSCKLPKRIQTVTRQGVTVGFMDEFQGLDTGRTGLWIVDSWIESIRGPRRGGTVRSPDVPHPRTRSMSWPT